MPAKRDNYSIHERLKNKSPWFLSINDPLHGADAKIPDETGVDTGTYQIVHKASFQTGASGCGGIKILTPYVNSIVNTAGGAGQNYRILDSASTPTTLSWTDTYAFPGADSLRAVSAQQRIVSCALYVQPEASLSENKGEYCIFASPYSDLVSPLYSDYANHYKATLVPLSQSNNKAGVVKWWPESRNNIGFKNFLVTNGTVFDNFIDSGANICHWVLGVVATGCANAVTFRVTMVVNYEFIPLYNTVAIISTSPSPQDAEETDLVELWTQDMEVATMIPAQRASSSPSPVKINHGESDDGTGFGMFYNIMKELLPIAGAALAIL